MHSAAVRCIAASLAFLFLLPVARAARAQENAPADSKASTGLHITSPLGRTGLVLRVRIVAQVDAPLNTSLSAVTFYVDGHLVGTVNSGPPYAVDWTDDNPFERREITVQASDSNGHVLRDTVVLPPYEVEEKTEVTGVLVETGVYDKGGKWVSNLAKPDFTLSENGAPQRIDHVSRETMPTDVVLLVDNSQSMSRRMDFVRTAAERLARAMHARDRVIVAPFNAHVGTITGPTSDAATVGQAIGAMHAGGGTALVDALIEATHLLQNSDGRRAVVLITDGYDENSTSDLASALRAVEESRATVYGVGIGGTAGISLKGETLLKRIAEYSGGRVFFPPREPDLVQVAGTISTDASTRYLITYMPSDQKKDGTWRGITVGVPAGLHVKARAGYFAPAPPPIRPVIEFTAADQEQGYVNVTAADLDVLEDGVVQSVDTFQEAVDPVSIVMALDSSGSMKKSADLVRTTAREFVESVRSEDSMALITFADKPWFANVLSTNRKWALEAIDKYTPIGGTALYDALWNSLMHLKGVPGRRAVVVLTDGRDENNPGTAPGSEHTFDQVLALERQVGAMVFAIGLGSKVDRPVLERLAAESGGETYFAAEAASLGGEFKRVIENLRRRYVLSYTSTNSDHDGAWRTIEIRPHAAKLRISTVGGYFAPEEETSAGAGR